MRPSFTATYPDRAMAACTRAEAAALLPWDHHRVQAGGRPGVLLTLDLMQRPLDELPEPLELLVVFHYAGAHPAAPPDVQAIVDTLNWQPAAPGEDR